MIRQFAKRLLPLAAAVAAATGYACACPTGDLTVTAINCTPTAVRDAAKRIALSCTVTIAGREASQAVHDTIPDPNQ